jgi:NADH:ubiquinone oxidoreductase subunit 2 (subunit N)
MAGIPPLAGFIGKFITLKFIISNNISVATVIIAITLLFTFAYTRPLINLFKQNKISNIFLHEKITGKNKGITSYKP